MIPGVYQILNIVNGKRYIGSATDTAARMRVHRRSLKRGTHHSQSLQRAWNKYGEAAFEFRVIQPCPREQLRFQEQRALHGFLPEYNIAKVAGSLRGIKATPEARANLSKALTGRKLSAEHRSNIGKGHEGLKYPPRTEEHKAKIGAGNRGKTMSPEACRKISAALTGRTRSPEHSAKLAITTSAWHQRNKLLSTQGALQA